ncbi:toprim domain-containing protein [Allochromatium humboldtianum]|uniref:Toprim domain-containing protein n=1 Tax=Allochromatium humboldtianum TaxID=504901 RepID=A0A850RIR0_9GAMM|nr:toprim domain-containing protein [Allochromatium humboldtianum]NVZ11367.1 toprim domain-containing protein [Allochromatium humboldtianum]
METWRAIDRFAEAIRAAGLGEPDIIGDGRIHRYYADGRRGQGPEWYKLHLNGLPAGAFGSWRLGMTESWCAKSRDEMNVIERADFSAMLAKARAERDAEQARQHQESANRAAAIWNQATPAPDAHPYLLKKGVRAHGTRVDRFGNLIIPASDGQRLTTLQFIAPDGGKKFLSGGRISGSWFAIGVEAAGAILIAEGFATAATLHQETGKPCVVAFNANNLLPVARAVRRLNPRADLIVCGDEDQWTPGNPGRTKARAAALDVGAKVLMPDFSGFDLSSKPTDWNDWYRLRPEIKASKEATR